MQTQFGPLLYKLRQERAIPAKELAYHLNVSITYISDIERQRRPPPTRARILAIASVLKIEPEHLFIAAALTTGISKLESDNTDEKRVVIGGKLSYRWPALTEKQLTAIDKVIA